MSRVILTDLALTVGRSRAGTGVFRVRWTLRESPVYPEAPGTSLDVRVLATADTELAWTAADGKRLLEGALDRAELCARLLVPEADALVDRAANARGVDRWCRARLSLHASPDDGLEALPWEALFATRGLLVMRGERAPDVPRWALPGRAALAFPLKLWATGPGAGAMRRELLDGYAERAIELGALAWCQGPDELPDIVHIPGAPMSVLGPWAVHPRVVVFHEPAAQVASASVTAEMLRRFGAEAALHLAGHVHPDAVRALYRKVLHDWPLDRCVGEMRERYGVAPEAVILHCRPRGEVCVTLSAIIDRALIPKAPEQEAARSSEMYRGTASKPGSPARLRAEQLREVWRKALHAPLEVLSERARDTVIEEEETDLEHAVALARDAAALALERAEVTRVVQALDAARPDEVAQASARVTQVWMTDARTAREVASDTTLATAHPYRLHVQIAREAGAAAWASQRFPEEALRATFERLGSVELTVMIHPLGEGIALSQVAGTMRLRAVGDSDPHVVDLSIARPGPFSIRVCIYYQLALLQSVVIEGRAGEHDAEPTALSRTLDFATSHDFMALGALPQPDVTIWTNQTADDTHWFGVFARNDEARVRLTRGRLSSLSSADLTTVARGLQSALGAVAVKPAPRDPRNPGGSEPLYRFARPAPADDRERDERLQQLAALAVAGWDAYNALFPELNPEDSPAASPSSGLLSIARCRPERTNIAWAALYDYHLDDPRPVVCDVFAAQLRTGEDLLDRPEECRAQASCPLGDPERRSRTVCPFGFWGLRHRIEQPPDHVPAARLLDAPAAMREAAHTKTAIKRPPPGVPRLGIAWWPHFDARVKTHVESLDALGHADLESERAKILALLAGGQKQIYYFFCHGVGENTSFVLQVGPSKSGDTIKVGDLNAPQYNWSPEGPAPLVFLNGCNTTAFKGDTINKLIDRLRAMGASGVIGTEIPVHTYLAEDVGTRVVEELARGKPLGLAFLTMRRTLLRTQINPLGLAYAFFGSDRLHLCEGERCATCGAVDPGESVSTAHM